MKRAFADFTKTFFPVREESRANRLAANLDRAILFFILLTALAAPVSIAATNAAWASGLAAWIVRIFIRPRPRFFRSPVDFPLLAFYGWSLFTCFFSYAPDLSFDRWRVLALFPIAYLVAQNVRSAKTVKLLAAALVFSCVVTAGWTFLERATGRGVQIYGVAPTGALAAAGLRDGDTLLKINGKKFRQTAELMHALAENETVKINYARLDLNYDAEIRRADLFLGGTTAQEMLGFTNWQRNRNWRATGFYNHFTTYAEVLQLILSVAFGIFIALPRKNTRIGILLLVCLAAMSVALLLTATRASQAGFLLSAFAIVALGAANRKVLLTLAAVLLPFAVVAGIYLQSARNVGFVDGADNSTTWRQTVYREGFELLTASPRHLAVGVGIDSINRFRCEWKLFANCTLPPGHLHSTPLQIAVDSGLPALFLWLFAVFRYGKILLLDAFRNRARDFVEKGILLGAFGGLIGFFAGGLVHYNLGDSEVAMVFYFIMGLSLALCREQPEKNTFSEKGAEIVG
jgi:hypothetical protein